jgi:hypothetical protein
MRPCTQGLCTPIFFSLFILKTLIFLQLAVELHCLSKGIWYKDSFTWLISVNVLLFFFEGVPGLGSGIMSHNARPMYTKNDEFSPGMLPRNSDQAQYTVMMFCHCPFIGFKNLILIDYRLWPTSLHHSLFSWVSFSPRLQASWRHAIFLENSKMQQSLSQQ